jgi:Mor family transcriptional regulator
MTKQKENSKYIITVRNRVIYQTWNEEKNFLSMKDLSKVFNISLPQVYKIVAQEMNKDINKNIIK